MGVKSHSEVLPYRTTRYRLLMYYCVFVMLAMVIIRIPIAQVVFCNK